MNTNQQIPGLNYPSIQGMNGATARDSAIQSGINADTKLAELTSIGGWGRQLQKYANKSSSKHTKHIRTKPDPKIVLMGGVGNANIVVPELLPTYKEVGGPGQTVVDVNVQLARIGTQGASNAEFDKYANVSGGAKRGSRRYRKIKSIRKLKSKKSNQRRTRKQRKTYKH
jgi:hypothetical protein